MVKRRLDVAVAELGFTESRQKAQAVIMAGGGGGQGEKKMKKRGSVGRGGGI